MIIYQSFGGDYYALCSVACKNYVAGYLADPDYRFQPATEHDDSPYCCWFCGTTIDPSTWGEEVPR